jgi:ankyrin repeat protein
MKKQLLFLTLLTGSSLMYAAAAAPTEEQLAQDEKELIRAVYKGNVAQVKRLLQITGINFNAEFGGLSALDIAAQGGNKDIVEMLLKIPGVEGKEDALIIAAHHGFSDIVHMLLEAHAHVNAADDTGRTALMWAANKGNQEIVEMLLKAGANKNMRDKNGMTAELFSWEKHYYRLENYIRDYKG